MSNDVQQTVITIPVVIGMDHADDLKALLNPDVLEANIKFLDDLVEILLNVHNGIGMVLDLSFFVDAEHLKSHFKKVLQGIQDGEQFKHGYGEEKG